MKTFTDCATALITPFKENEIDYNSLDKLIEMQIDSGIKTLVVCGTTAETSTLSSDERNMLISYVIEKVRGRCKIIVGTGSNDTNHAIELSNEAEKLGADALLIVTPYYNKCTQEGLYMHYSLIAQSVNIPIILYNVPSRTNVNLEVSTIEKLSRISNIVGIKEASKNIGHIMELFNKLDTSKFSIYCGNDDLTYLFYTLGGSGIISVVSNLIPYEISTMCNILSTGNFTKGKYFQFKYLNLINEIFKSINPIGIKEAMHLKHYCLNNLRLPLSNLNSDEITSLKSVLESYNIL